MAKNKRKPGDIDLGDGIYGPKPANSFGLMKRELSASELSRKVESTLAGLAATARQYRMLYPGRQVNYDNSSGRTVVKDDQTGAIIKPMLPSKARAIVTGRRVAARAESARTNKATTRKVGRKNQAF